MVFKSFTSPFGAVTRTRILVALHLLRATYPRELARVLDVNLNAIRKALASLELDGMVAGRAVGRTRLYELNPTYFAREELARFVARIAAADTEMRQRTAQLRRRPRRIGKPL